MSMIASLDVLDAVTDASTAPRAAVFKPKVKTRVKKGGAGGSSAASVPTKSDAISSVNSVSTSPVRSQEAVVTANNATTIPVVTFEADGSQIVSPTTEAFVDNVNEGVYEPSVIQEGTAPSSTDDNPAPLASIDIPKQDERPAAVRSKIPSPVRLEIPSLRSQSSPTRTTSGDQSERASKRSSESGIVRKSQSTDGDGSRENSLGFKTDTARKTSARSISATKSRKRVDNDEERFPELGGGANSVEEQPASPPMRRKEMHSVAIDTARAGEEPSGIVAKVAPVDKEQGTKGGDLDEAAPETLSTGSRRSKRAFPHSTSRSRRSRTERADITPKIDFSKTDLSDPGKLTMREIIRRAEAIERKKMKVDTTKEVVEKNAKEKQAAATTGASRDVSMTPQVQVINGRIVINEQSLTVEAYASSRQNTDSYRRVEENAPKLNYNSYLNRPPVERWKSEDTELFYKALEQFGTDFELILNLFPGRTRRQIKAKFKKEEKNDPRRLQVALAHRPKDQAHYTDMITRLKADEPVSGADDPLANILADASAPAAGEHFEDANATAASKQPEDV